MRARLVLVVSSWVVALLVTVLVALVAHGWGYSRGALHVGALSDATLIGHYMVMWEKGQEGLEPLTAR